MILTIKEAYAMHEAMSILIQSGKEYKGKLGLAFAYNFRLLHDSLGEYITRRDKIIRKYADKIDENTRKENDKNGIPNPVIISDPDRIDKANAEIKEFEDLKIDVPLMAISVKDLEKDESLTSNDFSVFISMIGEYKEELNNVKVIHE